MADVVEPCPVCAGDSVLPLYDLEDLAFGAPGRWPFVVCEGCGHGMISPRPSDESLRVLYEQLYTPDKLALMEKVGASPFDRMLRRRRVEAVRDALGGRRAERLLDVGCGVGRYLQELSDVVGGARVGVELGPPAAASARARGVEVHELPFDELALSEPVDVVSMNHFLEHHPRPHEAVRKAVSLLRPGGLLQIEVPRLDGWGRNLLGRWWWPHLPPQHVHLFRAAGLERLLTESGLTVERRYTVGYPLTATAGWMFLVRRLIGRDSGRGALARAIAWPVGLLGMPVPLLVDVLAGWALDRLGRGDIVCLVARRGDA